MTSGDHADQGPHGTGPVPSPPPAPRGGLLAPSAMKPVELDLRRVFLAGLALWLVAGAVATVLVATGQLGTRVLWICAAGVGLGLLALMWEARRRRRLRRVPDGPGVS